MHATCSKQRLQHVGKPASHDALASCKGVKSSLTGNRSILIDKLCLLEASGDAPSPKKN